MSDPEIGAMSTVSGALVDLDPAAQRRVLEWASARFLGTSLASLDSNADAQGEVEPEFADLVDLFHAANPQTAADKALVAAYWFQHVQGRPILRAQDINAGLRDLGHGLPNVTDALRTLEQRKPALVRQTGKSGRSQQARKSYKMTVEGANRVRHLVSGGDAVGESDA